MGSLFTDESQLLLLRFRRYAVTSSMINQPDERDPFFLERSLHHQM